MPYIKVNLSALSAFSSTLNESKNKLGKIKSNFTSTVYALDWDVKSSSNIRSRIELIERELENEYHSISKMISFFTSASSQYSNVEESINENSIAKTKTTGQVTTASTIATNNSVKKPINKILESFGYAGSIISSISSVINTLGSDVGAKTVAEVAKGGKTLVKGLYDWAKSAKALDKLKRMDPGKATSVGIKRIFGLNKAFTGALKPSVAKSFGTRFYNNFQKQWSSKTSAYTAGGAKSVFAWAGVGISAITNAFQNYDEAKSGSISAGRAVAETITETAVDVGVGLAVGAAVGAGLAAAGFVSAPVLAVGAISAGVIIGADHLCKKITGAITGTEKGLTETVSDFVLDVGTAAVKGGSKIVSNVVKEVSNIGNSIGSFFKKLF